ncbi:hypothetical protein [Microcoleus sp. FACHB-672]|uniref:hypothetical protein n=1 Tax=Microcoleus sp. FACHB-672 TaxID=2692825 RepID=UPI001681CBBA|nr:hypothetical protein [Microcoleus sp. FACHB-672]MBD2043406.1 hypothetical protein [Microcoleus sp. FACHB-672]
MHLTAKSLYVGSLIFNSLNFSRATHTLRLSKLPCISGPACVIAQVAFFSKIGMN